MKKLRLASFCFAVFSLGSLCACTPSVAPSVSPSASPSPTVAEALPFGAEDLTIQGLRLGQSTLEQAKEHLGEGSVHLYPGGRPEPLYLSDQRRHYLHLCRAKRCIYPFAHQYQRSFDSRAARHQGRRQRGGHFGKVSAERAACC